MIYTAMYLTLHKDTIDLILKQEYEVSLLNTVITESFKSIEEFHDCKDIPKNKTTWTKFFRALPDTSQVVSNSIFDNIIILSGILNKEENV